MFLFLFSKVILGKIRTSVRLLDAYTVIPGRWVVKDIEHDSDSQECYIAMEALCEVLQSKQPLIVYFPDYSLWLSRAAPKSNCKEFISKVQEMFDQLSGPVALICGQNKVETGSKEKEKFVMLNY